MLKIGLIGCGHISETYFKSQTYFNNINIVACADINIEAASKCAQKYKIQAKDVDDLLTNKEIDIILLFEAASKPNFFRIFRKKQLQIEKINLSWSFSPPKLEKYTFLLLFSIDFLPEHDGEKWKNMDF